MMDAEPGTVSPPENTTNSVTVPPGAGRAADATTPTSVSAVDKSEISDPNSVINVAKPPNSELRVATPALAVSADADAALAAFWTALIDAFKEAARKVWLVLNGVNRLPLIVVFLFLFAASRW
jgi:hypothetical protein